MFTGFGAYTDAERLEAQAIVQRIYSHHQVLKALARRRGLTKELVNNAVEFAKFVQVAIDSWGKEIRPSVLANWQSVVAETPRLQEGLGIVPLIIFGILLLAGAFTVGHFVVAKKKLDVDEVEAKERLVKLGVNPADLFSDTSFLGQIRGIGMIGLLGALLWFGKDFFKKPGHARA